MMRELLLDPDAFYAQRGDQPTLTAPAIVVLLAAITGMLTGLLVVFEISKELDEGAGQVLAIGGVSSVLAVLVSTFGLWLVYSGAFLIISLFFEGEGGFRPMLSYVGWGFVPAIFNGLVTVVAVYIALQSMTMPSDPAAAGSVQGQLQSQPIVVAATIGGIAFSIWQGFIWSFAVKHVSNLELREAVLTVAAPVAISIVWTVYNLL